MNDSCAYKHAKRLAQRRIGGELFVVDPAKRCLHQPQGAGDFLWERLAQGATAAELASALTEEYEVTPETALKDVRRYLTELRRKKLVDEA